MTTPRTIAAVALAAGTFGGTIGALATAAVQSQASPGAIAAAVQRIQDQKAENTLQSINSKLGAVSTKLATLNTDFNPDSGELVQLANGLASQFSTLDGSVGTVNSSVGSLTQHLEFPGEFGGALNANAENLWAVCQDTPGANLFRCQLP